MGNKVIMEKNKYPRTTTKPQQAFKNPHLSYANARPQKHWIITCSLTADTTRHRATKPIVKVASAPTALLMSCSYTLCDQNETSAANIFAVCIDGGKMSILRRDKSASSPPPLSHLLHRRPGVAVISLLKGKRVTAVSRPSSHHLPTFRKQMWSWSLMTQPLVSRSRKSQCRWSWASRLALMVFQQKSISTGEKQR